MRKVDQTSGLVELQKPVVLPGLSAAPSPPASGKFVVCARNRAGGRGST